MSIPKVGDYYRHHSGRVYRVVLVANDHGTNPEYPVSVAYEGENGFHWIKTIERFNQTMTPLDFKYAFVHRVKNVQIRITGPSGSGKGLICNHLTEVFKGTHNVSEDTTLNGDVITLIKK